MKRIFLYLFLLFSPVISGQILTGVVASSQGISSIVPEPISGWDLNEVSGSAVDFKSINNLPVVNVVTQHVSGEIGYACSFTAANGAYIGGIDATYEYTSALSISFWINTASVGWSGILGNYSTDADLGYDFELTDDGKIDFSCRYASGSPYAETNSAINTGAWVHIVGTWDGTTIKLYVNGTVQTITGSLTSPIEYDATCLFCVGNRNIGASGFTGVLDMPRIWNIALTQPQVTELYTKENAGTTYPW
jgi:large repetitive protein